MNLPIKNEVSTTNSCGKPKLMKLVSCILCKPSVYVALLSALLIACDSALIPGGGGIGGTGIISGPVDGFGSIIIADERFDTDNATFEVNGQEALLTDLQIGMRVSAVVDFETMRADKVFYQPIVAGPIESYSEETGVLKVLHQELQIDENSILNSLTPEGLIPGLVVEVSGERNSDNIIYVDYLTTSNDSQARYIIGRVEDTEEETHRALVSGTILGYKRAQENLNLTNTQYSDTFLNSQSLVRVELPEDYWTADCNPQIPEGFEFIYEERPFDPEWVNRSDCAPVIAVSEVRDIILTPGEEAEMVGIVVHVPSSDTFIVNGIEIVIVPKTTIQSSHGNLEIDKVIRLNDVVSVRGRATTDSRLHAKNIRIKKRISD